jgi:hypothetical protein
MVFCKSLDGRLALSDALSDALSALSDSPLISIGVLAKVTFRRLGGPQAVLWLSRCRRSKTWNVCTVLPGRTPSREGVVQSGMVVQCTINNEVEYVSFIRSGKMINNELLMIVLVALTLFTACTSGESMEFMAVFHATRNEFRRIKEYMGFNTWERCDVIL